MLCNRDQASVLTHKAVVLCWRHAGKRASKVVGQDPGALVDDIHVSPALVGSGLMTEGW